MNAADALDTLPATPARRGVRYLVTMTNGETFTVLVLRGMVPRERVASQLAETEQVRSIERTTGF